MYLVTAKEMQNIDRATIESFGIPGQVLMENAGRGAFDMLLRLFPDIGSLKVAVMAGKGNNGGDAFVIARYLLEKGIDTTTFMLSSKEKISGDARANLLLLEKIVLETQTRGADSTEKFSNKNAPLNQRLIEIPDMERFHGVKNRILHHDLFIDGILGTGINSSVRDFYGEVIDTLNGTTKPIFSIDVPSGLNSDTGEAMGRSINATATATFAFAKVGHMLHPGKQLTGTLEIIDIGIPGFITAKENPRIHLIDKDMIRPLFPDRSCDSHKGTHGHLMVVAGSVGKTGAAALTCNSAMACGTGLVTLAIPESINSTMEHQVTESMTIPMPDNHSIKGTFSRFALENIRTAAMDKSALAMGPGLGLTQDTIELVQGIIADPSLAELSMVIDADGLNAVAEDIQILKKREARATTILTPHPGEMARLTGRSTTEIQKNRIKYARELAETFHVVVVLKGSGTVVALPDNRIYICPTGNPGMASGGMGDLLTGIIAGLLAQGFTARQASVAGVYIHGMCGDILAKERGKFGFPASDIIKIIPETVESEILGG